MTRRLTALAAALALTLANASATAADRTDGCWAELFLSENFEGNALTLHGATEVDNIARDWGFPWDPLYESLRVGPRGSLTVFENPHFRDRTATFGPGRRIPDLDEAMGIFRTIRSVRLRCS